eukprot:Nk52_evm1s860 gene=Nk52_evmTU1s860
MRSVTIIAFIALCACIVVLLPLSVQGESEKTATISIGLGARPIVGEYCYEEEEKDEDEDAGLKGSEMKCEPITRGTNPIELKAFSEEGDGYIRIKRDSSLSKYKEYIQIDFKYHRPAGTTTAQTIEYTISTSEANTRTALYPTRDTGVLSTCGKITSSKGGESKCKIDTPMTFNYV